MTQPQENINDGWIYPLLNQEDSNKNFFVWSDLDFKDPDAKLISHGTSDDKKIRPLVNEKNVAMVQLKRSNPVSNYDYVPIDPSALPDPQGSNKQRYLLYCLGSSNQKTPDKINEMITKSFDMLNDVEPELTKRNFQIWVVANPAAYQLNRDPKVKIENYEYTDKHSILFHHISKLKDSINVFDWFGSIEQNTTEDFRTIQYAKYGYYDFQKLVLFHVMASITNIPVLKLEIERNTPKPYVKESFFLKLSSDANFKKKPAESAITSSTASNIDDLKGFYGILREAYELENTVGQQPINYSSAITADNSVAGTVEKKTFHKGGFGKIVTQGTYKKINLEVAIKVLDARLFNGDLENLKKKLTDIKHDYIIIIRDIATDMENFNVFYIATEYCKKGSLFQLICKERPRKDLFVRFIKNIAEALIYLHKRNIMHCDIKPGNVIIDTYDNAKICDIDSIQWMNNSDACLLPDVQYTPRYAAPELEKGELCDSRVDVWSYTLVVLELIVEILKPKFCQDLREGETKSLNKVLFSVPESLQKLIRAGLIVETRTKTEKEKPKSADNSKTNSSKTTSDPLSFDSKAKTVSGAENNEQNILTPLTDNQKNQRIFMTDMVLLIEDVNTELGLMTNEKWQECAKEHCVNEHVEHRRLHNYVNHDK